MHNDISELVLILIIFLIVLFTTYKLIRALYINSRYKICPKCNSKTLHTQEIEYSFADQETYEVIQCSNVKCDFKYKFKY